MIYLLRITETIDIAACENDKPVSAYKTQGYRIVTRAQYIAAWQARDRLALVALGLVRQPKVKPPRIRAVGGWEVGDFWNKQ